MWLLLGIILGAFSGRNVFAVPCDMESPGLMSQVICVSKTQFIFDWEELATATPTPCPMGMSCSDVSEVCSSSAAPVCKNARPNELGTCNECLDDIYTNRVCTSENEYSICVKGKVQATMSYKCPYGQFCHAVVEIDGEINRVTSICTRNRTKSDCPPKPGSQGSIYSGGAYGGSQYYGYHGFSGITQRNETTQKVECTAPGFFPNPLDRTCLTFIKCFSNSFGKLDYTFFQCPEHHAFNPEKKRCEKLGSFICRVKQR